MKKMLPLFLLLAATGAGHAQTWKSPLPVDSANGHVAYYGTVFLKGTSAADLFTRAKVYGATSISGTPVIDEAAKLVTGTGSTTVTWLANGKGHKESRTLRYGVVLKSSEGLYSYELIDFANVTDGAQYAASPGVLANVAGQSAPLEKLLDNPDNYDRKHQPTANYQAYVAAVNSAVGDVLQHLKERMAANR